MITDKTLTKGQLQTRAAAEARRAAALRRRLDKAAAALAAQGWNVVMPDGTAWRAAGDAR